LHPTTRRASRIPGILRICGVGIDIVNEGFARFRADFVEDIVWQLIIQDLF
jgi:hypothetical protein